MNAIDLEGRVAVVTGGAQGIGHAVAERFLASGAEVWLWDRDAALVERGRRGARRPRLVVDQTDADAVVAAAEAVVRPSAGSTSSSPTPASPGRTRVLWEYDVAEWHRIVDVNLNGVFHCCRAVVPHMLARGYGRIVTVASIAGKEGNPNAAAYSASKAGVIALTKSLGKETAGKDIAVNCVTPAAARTRIFDQMSQAHIDYMLSRIPRGRFLEVTRPRR